MAKKLMLLGGIRYLLPVIKAAHEQGHYVITADYIPDNIAHKYSDEYVNVSIVDKEAVLRVAQEKKIDGIMSFGVDPGVVSAAYVADKMNLPNVGPYESVCILQNKDKFRSFLRDNGFTVPGFKEYADYDSAILDKASIKRPMIIKPVDSAGSKGVTRVDNLEDFDQAVKKAFQQSISKRIIIEDFIEKSGFSTDSECFSVDGELRFVSYSSQRFDDSAVNPYAPAAFSWPSSMTSQQEGKLTSELQRLLSLLKMRTTIYNVEARIGVDGKAYIMEVSPRGGGNRLAEMIRYSTGVDLIGNAVRAAMGDVVEHIEQRDYKGNWAEVVLHSDKDGILEKIEVDETIKPYLVDTDLWVQKGMEVHSFKGANETIGTLVLNFPIQKDRDEALKNIRKWLKIIVN